MHCEFDTGYVGRAPSSLEPLIKKRERSLELARTEKERCGHILGRARAKGMLKRKRKGKIEVRGCSSKVKVQ